MPRLPGSLVRRPKTPSKILAAYPQLSASEKQAALATLASRVPYGVELLKAVSDKQIPAKDLSADLVRQLHNLKDESIDKMVGDVWGQVRSTPADKAALIDNYRKLLAKKTEQTPDPNLGRTVFSRTCQQCHTLYGVGANIGPDLTGSNRADVEYLLTNIVDPSALIAKEYQPTIFTTSDGRVITGIVSAENDKAVTVRTATETIILPKNEIDDRTLSKTSMMPEDPAEAVHDARDTFAIRLSARQVAGADAGDKRQRNRFFQRPRSDRLDGRVAIVVGRERRNRRPQSGNREQHVSIERPGRRELPTCRSTSNW